MNVAVTLPSDTLYVSGTVNGAAVPWTRAEEDVWEAAASRSADDVYRVELTAINAAGTAANSRMTLYYGLHLITDRTAQDVALGTKKGFYNAEDLNRVWSAMNYVAGRFRDCGYAVTVHPKTDWAMGDVPTHSQMQTYVADAAALRAVISVMESTPQAPPDMAGLTWEEANNIEQILEDVDALLTNMAAAWVYSGEIYSGEV